ncbi:hypothetical protein L4X63_17310 [Geomonas sp. Red32]|uniref:right-handed parallel beta-helix repeat-containing protein n=1 Tax=Geomonas sp. Red32 TaxID=2912856 RepID=UPI00202CC5DA|nr:hypothetical protein [Geomonas sp. Red32]MCM0083347.1 hypothetical protein [Geomonas sp. Red32]
MTVTMGNPEPRWIKKPLLAAFFLLLSLLLAGETAASPRTYFVDPAAPDDGGNGSTQRPKKFITSGVELLSSGDTLVLKDGIYRGGRNCVGDQGTPRLYPPSGNAGKYTTIRAEHVGGAIVDGGYAQPPFASADRNGSGIHYLHLDGIHFRHGRGGVFSLKGSHNKVTNCGFEDGMPAGASDETPIAFIAGGSSYSLVEDCWVWGKGRYGFYTSSPNGGTHHIVFRRVVVRLDGSPPWVTAGLRFYNAHDNVMQNCVVLDSLVNREAAEPTAFAQGGGSSRGDADNSWLGVIALNNPQMWGYNANDVLKTETVADSIFWGNHDGVFMTIQKVKNAASSVKLSRLTIGANSGYALRHNAEYPYRAELSDSLVVAGEGGTAFREPSSVANTVVQLSAGARLGSAPPGAREWEGALSEAGLRYLPRVEPGSRFAKEGVGASVLYRIGREGTLYGEPGWDEVTAIPLWPFVNERLWARKMREYAGNGPIGKRGFALLPGETPLSDYVWGYLGEPAPPFGLEGTAGAGEVRLQWLAKEEAAGYRIRVGRAPGQYQLPVRSVKGGTGGTVRAAVGGLTPGTGYYFAVSAVDHRGRESGTAYPIGPLRPMGPIP